MKATKEHVVLPDAKTHFLVHPMDLDPARRPFITSWVLGILGSPQVFAAVAALVWVLTNSFVVPFIAAGATLLVANLASTYFRRDAWSYIPGQRRDSGRALRGLNLLAAVLQALALAAAMILLILWFAGRAVSPEVFAFATGAVTAVAVLMAVDVVVTAVRTRNGTDVLGPLVNLLVVAAVSWWGFLVIAGRTGALSFSAAVTGAVVLLVVYGVWRAWTLWQQRRIAGGQPPPAAAPAA